MAVLRPSEVYSYRQYVGNTGLTQLYASTHIPFPNHEERQSHKGIVLIISLDSEYTQRRK